MSEKQLSDSAENNKMSKIEVEFDSETHSLLEEQAKSEGLTASELVKKIIEVYARSAAVLKEQRRRQRYDKRGRQDPKGGRRGKRGPNKKLPLARIFLEQNHEEQRRTEPGV